MACGAPALEAVQTARWCSFDDKVKRMDLIYVLVVVTVFTSSAGLATDTRFHEFDSKSACNVARDGIVAGIDKLHGTLGRTVYAHCFAKK